MEFAKENYGLVLNSSGRNLCFMQVLKSDGDRLQKLVKAVEELKSRMKRNLALPQVLEVAMDFPCPARCFAELDQGNSLTKIDPFYKERHDLIRRLFIDALFLRFKELGLTLPAHAEHISISGRGDVDLATDTSSLMLDPGMKIRVELKGGENFDLAQIFRYLLDFDAVVVCIAGSGRAFKITKSDSTEFLDFIAEIVLQKIHTLTDKKDFKISGPWCAGCKLDCEYAKKEQQYRSDFNRDLIEPLNNWQKAIRQAVNQVISIILTQQPKYASITEQRVLTA